MVLYQVDFFGSKKGTGIVKKNNICSFIKNIIIRQAKKKLT